MCMFCAAIPVTAAAGVSLDSKQRRKRQAEGRPTQRIHPIPLVTAFVIVLLMVGSAIFHLKFPKLF